MVKPQVAKKGLKKQSKPNHKRRDEKAQKKYNDK